MHTKRLQIFALILLLFGCSKPPAPVEPVQTSTASSSSVPLFDNLGSHHHRITTTNPLAQKYFDQGLRLVYGFNHDEAERAFQEAARLDPNCGMAWWGVAYTLGPNYNLPMIADRNQKALDAVQKAQSLASRLSEPEQAYIAAIATRYSPDAKADRAKLDRAYGDAMKALHLKYPEDNDASVLYAESLMDLKPWQLWTHDGKPNEETEEILKVLEDVLARDPNHPGANHYYIHAIEASPNPEKGAASAQRLQTLVPGAGHLVHMPAHIFIRTGDYEGAIDANAKAARADEEYFARSKADGMYPVMYYTHNFQFLSTAAGMLGQSKQAIDAAAKAVANVKPMAGQDPMVEYVLPWSLYALARAEKWDDILAYPQPSDATPVTLAMWRYARGLAHLGKGNVPAATSEKQDLATAIEKVPKDAMLNTNRALDLLSIASAILDARLSAAGGNSTAAVTDWLKAVSVQDQLIYDEPPAWYYPVRESLGGEYLRMKKPAEAEKVFRRDLEINKNNPRSLFGLSEALRAQRRNPEADAVKRQFEQHWKSTEVTLSIGKL
jgi:tetratricopeptide (TPR) repeat protein